MESKSGLIDRSIVARPRSLMHALGSVLLILLLFSPLIAIQLGRLGPLRPEAVSHSLRSLELAMNGAWCGHPSHVSAQYPIVTWLTSTPALFDRPLRVIAAEHAQSFERYCDTVTTAAVNNENSLMLLEQVALRLMPDSSARRLERVLFLLPIIVAALFALGVLLLGAPLIVAAAAFACAVTINASLNNFPFTVYPLILPFVLLQVGVAAVALRFGLTSRLLSAVGLAVIAGALSAFTVNLRTDSAPVCLLIWALFFMTTTQHVGERARRRLGAGVAAAFAVGWVMFTLIWIRPLSAGIDTYNSTNHPIAHPLVLSLAYPRNEFADRVGIAWDDETGHVLALSVDPHVLYLGPGYESALFRFYRELWRTHPREMLSVYTMKFGVAGRSMLIELDDTVRSGTLWWKALTLPLRGIPTGLLVFLLLAGAAFWTLRCARRDGNALALTAAMVATAGLAVHLESSVLVSRFVLQYHSVELFAVGAACIGAYWLLFVRMVMPWARANWLEARAVLSVMLPVALMYGIAGLGAARGVLTSDLAGRVLSSAVAYAILSGVAYGVCRTVCSRRLSGFAAVLCVVLAVGRPASSELVAAVSMIVLLFVVWRGIVAPSKSAELQPAALLTGASGAIAAIAGAGLLSVLTAITLGSVLTASLGRAVVRLAAAFTVFAVVVWFGGGPANSDQTSGFAHRDQLARATIVAAMDRHATNAVPEFLLRSRLHVASVLTWFCLWIAPLAALAVCRRRVRTGLWLLCCWTWCILVAPGQGEAFAVAGFALVAGVAVPALAAMAVEAFSPVSATAAS